MSVRESTIGTVIVALLAVAGCDGGGDTKADAAAKEAADAKAAEEAERDERRAEIKKKREAEEAADAKAAADKQAELDRLCVVPEGTKLPKKLGDACRDVATAYDEFTRRHFADDPDTLAKWEEGKSGQLQFTETNCKKSGSLEAAVCAKHALDNASAALREDAPEILRICLDEFRKETKAE